MCAAWRRNRSPTFDSPFIGRPRLNISMADITQNAPFYLRTAGRKAGGNANPGNPLLRRSRMAVVRY